MQLLIETEALPRPIHLRLPAGLLCSSLVGALLDKALQTAQEPDPEDDGTAVARSEAAATEKESTLPWRSLMGPLRAFAKEHPGFPLCEIQTNGTHVKLLL